MYLPATPEEFRAGGISREELRELQENPPEWLTELRRNGPHPRPVVAGRLGVSISGLARGGVDEALTTEQIDELRRNPPPWLVEERERFARVRAEEERLRAAQRAEGSEPPEG
ncbi:hypothetical protein GCM10027212_34490 [Actinotalea caeni]